MKVFKLIICMLIILFCFLQAGATSCFNTQCPGFVIVNTEIALDAVLEPTSQRGGPIYELTLFVYRVSKQLSISQSFLVLVFLRVFLKKKNSWA